MTIKIICSVLIAVIGFILGKNLADTYAKKEKFYGQTENLLQYLETETDYRKCTVAEIFRRCAACEEMPRDLCRYVDENLGSGRYGTFDECWSEACRKWFADKCGELSLQRQDKELMENLLIRLFDGEEENRKNQFRVLQERIGERRKTIAEERKTKQSLYGKLGMLCGATVAVLLF